jgi:hypothetical protein
MARALVEQTHALDMRRLHRAGMLRPGASGALSWRTSFAGEPGPVTAQLTHAATHDGAVSLVFRPVHGDARPQVVALAWTACRYGGARPWFRCPALGCGRMCAILYQRGAGIFACRRCWGLAYRSQRMTQLERLEAKAERLYARIGSSPDDDVAEKPPRMWWRTFNRIVDQAEAADAAACSAAALGIQRAASRLGAIGRGRA